jgi:hypothetical protein
MYRPPARRPKTVALAALALSCACLGSAQAASFRTEQLPYLGASVIHLEGMIAAGDLMRLRDAVMAQARDGDAQQTWLSLNSTGGNVQEAVAMALYLRRSGIGTVLRPGATCASACSIVFFGGYSAEARQPRRLAFERARLGVHRASLPPNAVRTARQTVDANLLLEAVQRQVAWLIRVLHSLEVSPAVQARFFETPSSMIHYLAEEEQRHSRIVIVRGRPGRWQLDAALLPDSALPPGLRRQGEVAAVSGAAGKGAAPAPATPWTRDPAPETTASVRAAPALAGLDAVPILTHELPVPRPVLSAPSTSAPRTLTGEPKQPQARGEEKPRSASVAMVTPEGAPPRASTERPVSAADFIRQWHSMVGQRVTVDGCTVVTGQADALSCTVFESRRQLGAITIRVQDLEAPMADWAWRLCTRTRPTITCSASLTGVVRDSLGSPRLEKAVVRF